MDPASAAVAFVGFAASLATLVGLAIESTQTINNFCSKLKRSPKELERLQSTVNQSRRLLALLEEQTSQHADENLPQTLREYWLENAMQMYADYEQLKKIALKLQGQFDLSSASKNHVRARIRQFFRSDEISELETRLSAHVAKFQLALTMIAQIRSEHMNSTLAEISQQTITTHSTIQDGHSMSYRREEYLFHIAEEMSGLRKDIRSTLNQVTKPDPVDRQRSPCRVQSDGGNLPPELLRILRETEGKSIVRNYWFGSLRIVYTCERTSTAQLRENTTLGSRIGPIKLQMTFVPPWWISDTLIAVAIDSSMRFSINRGQVNTHPRILEVLKSCDVDGLQELFRCSLARPTDLVPHPCIPTKTPVSIFQYIHSMSSGGFDSAYFDQSSWPYFYEFVLQETGAMFTNTNDELCSSLMKYSAYKKISMCERLINRGVNLSGILNSEASITGQTGISILMIMYAEGPRSFIHEFCFRHIDLEEYWEMTDANSWILRVIARSEPRFCSKLKAQEESLRFSRSHNRSKARPLGLDFSLKTQLIEMKQANPSDRHWYLLTICAGGTATELDALIAHPEDVPELASTISGDPRIYLEVSALYGNQETFHSLLGATLCYQGGAETVCHYLSGRRGVRSQFNDLPSSNERRAKMAECLLTKSGVPADIIARLLPAFAPDSSDYAIWNAGYFPESRDWSKLAPDNTRTILEQNGWLLAVTIASNNNDALEQLIHSGCDLEWQNKGGFTPLMLAIAQGAKQATQLLVEAGADLQQRKACGFSVLELASALRAELETHGSLRRYYNTPSLRGKIPWLPAFPYRPSEPSREELLDTLASVPQFDLELKHDDEESSLNLDTTPKSALYQQSTLFGRLYSQFFKFDSALIVIGYLIGITVHICYDFHDSMSWVLRLPRPAIRTLVVIVLVILYRWFWKVSTEYFTSFYE